MIEKKYKLLDKNEKVIFSETSGQFGGHKKMKIYGKLDCSSALRYIEKGQYVKYRVFFADKETTESAGYRPCAVCMRKEYLEWKQKN